MSKTLKARAAALSISGILAVGVAACGEDDFANEPRPPIPLQLTGVVRDEGVTISPGNVGAGPIVLTVSNQTGQPHTITLDGEGVEEMVGPVDPTETVSIQKTLKPGNYSVRAGSPEASPREIMPGRLVIGPERDTSSDDTLLP